MSTEETPIDKAVLAKELQKIIAFCTPEKESMRRLRIAGPTWRHHAAGKESAYEEVVTRLNKLAAQLEIELPKLK